MSQTTRSRKPRLPTQLWLALPGPRVQPVLLALRELMVVPAQPVLRAQQVLRGPLAQLVLQAPPVAPDQLDQRDLPDRLRLSQQLTC